MMEFFRKESDIYMEKAGLVLEGGGMRGAYTAGLLAAFMDEGITFPYVIGVSAGANNGANFIARQKDRGKKVFVDYVVDKRFSGLKNIIKEKTYFGMDFLFDVLPNKLAPFDYKTFHNSSTVFKVGVTDCKTGKPIYLRHHDFDPHIFMEKVLRASSSLPLISKPVDIDGRKYLDGGISDPIPIEKSVQDGNRYNVVVLTRNAGYRKEASKVNMLVKRSISKYPNLLETLKQRHNTYNETLDKIDTLQGEGDVYVFRPKKEIIVDRLERDIDKLDDLYKQGYNETMEEMEKFKMWLNGLDIVNYCE